MVVVVHHVDIVDGLGLLGLLAQHPHGLPHRQLLIHGDIVHGHQPAGGLGMIRHELAEVLGLVRLHQVEDGGGALFGQVGQQVRPGIRLHLLDDVGRLLIAQLIDDGHLQVRLHLLHRVGGDLLIHRP